MFVCVHLAQRLHTTLSFLYQINWELNWELTDKFSNKILKSFQNFIEKKKFVKSFVKGLNILQREIVIGPTILRKSNF